MRVWGIEGRNGVFDVGVATESMGRLAVVAAECARVGGLVGAVERRSKSAGGLLLIDGGGCRCRRRRIRRGSAGKIEGSSTDGDTILSVIDASTVGQDVNVGAFGPEFAVSLE